MRRIEPFFPLSLGIPIVDDRRVISGIIFVIRNGLRWRDAPAANGPPKAIYNRFKRWSEMGVFARIFLVPAKVGRETSEPNVDYANSLEKPVPDHAQKFFAFSFWDKRAPLDSTSTASGAVRARFPGRVAIPSARKMRDGALKTWDFRCEVAGEVFQQNWRNPAAYGARGDLPLSACAAFREDMAKSGFSIVTVLLTAIAFGGLRN